MFTVRPYEDRDAGACGECLFDGFFSGPVGEGETALLRDYAAVLADMSGFMYVAETEDGRVAGFISGRYGKEFAKAGGLPEGRVRYGRTLSLLAKYRLNGYRLSEGFRAQFDGFLRQSGEKDEKLMGRFDLELLALASRRDCRGGVGTALLEAFTERAERDGARVVRVFTNTTASWGFYERRGFSRVAEKPFPDGSGETSLVYELLLTDRRRTRLPPVSARRLRASCHPSLIQPL